MVAVLFRFPLGKSQICPVPGLVKAPIAASACFDISLPLTHSGRSMLLVELGTKVPFYFRSKLATIVRVAGRRDDTCCYDTAETERFENI